MARISLTLIQTFYEVATHGSFSGAARELNLSYQSAANHVRRLEQILRAKLIESEQGAKRIALTPRGRALYNLLHPELDVMLERLTKLMENQRSALRVGMPQAIFFYLFPRVLNTFRVDNPDMEIAAYERDTVLAELVKNGSLDICLSERYFGDPVVPQRLLGSYRLSLVYPRAWGAPPAPDDVPAWAEGRPLVTFEPGQTLRNLAFDFLGRDGAVVQAGLRHHPLLVPARRGREADQRQARQSAGGARLFRQRRIPQQQSERAPALRGLPRRTRRHRARRARSRGAAPRPVTDATPDPPTVSDLQKMR